MPWLVGAIALAVVLVVVAVLVLRNLFGPSVAGPGPGPNPSASSEVCPDAVLETARLADGLGYLKAEAERQAAA